MSAWPSVRCGAGISLYADGSRFHGNFLNDKKHGPGTYIASTGHRMNGTFVEGHLLPTATPGFNIGTLGSPPFPPQGGEEMEESTERKPPSKPTSLRGETETSGRYVLPGHPNSSDARESGIFLFFFSAWTP